MVQVVPFVEGRVLGVALQGSLLDDEPHLLEEGGRGGRRLPLQQDVDRPRHGRAKLAVLAHRVVAALRVFAVDQAIYTNRLEIIPLQVRFAAP